MMMMMMMMMIMSSIYLKGIPGEEVKHRFSEPWEDSDLILVVENEKFPCPSLDTEDELASVQGHVQTPVQRSHLH